MAERETVKGRRWRRGEAELSALTGSKRHGYGVVRIHGIGCIGAYVIRRGTMLAYKFFIRTDTAKRWCERRLDSIGATNPGKAK